MKKREKKNWTKSRSNFLQSFSSGWFWWNVAKWNEITDPTTDRPSIRTDYLLCHKQAAIFRSVTEKEFLDDCMEFVVIVIAVVICHLDTHIASAAKAAPTCEIATIFPLKMLFITSTDREIDSRRTRNKMKPLSIQLHSEKSQHLLLIRSRKSADLYKWKMNWTNQKKKADEQTK